MLVLGKYLFKRRVVFFCLPPRAKDGQNGEADNENEYETGEKSPKGFIEKFEHTHKYTK